MTRNKITIFFYEWPNTAGNHAGMAYFFRYLKHRVGFPVRLVGTPRGYGTWRHGIRRLYRRIWVEFLALTGKPGDTVYLTEYLGGKNPGNHSELARELRNRGVSSRLIGLVHLPLGALRDLYDEAYIRNALSLLDRIVVLGSSLANDLAAVVSPERILQSFLFVDTDFYRPAGIRKPAERLRVAAMGFLYRDRALLETIVKECPKIDFDLFLGNHEELHRRYSCYPNAFLNRFLPEAELLAKMQQADVSISAFADTVGSNVITTSLACGLPQVVSDVGSIRDYCSEENAVFCRKPEAFIQALRHLDRNRNLLPAMGRSARQAAERIALHQAVEWHRDLFSGGSGRKGVSFA